MKYIIPALFLAIALTGCCPLCSCDNYEMLVCRQSGTTELYVDGTSSEVKDIEESDMDFVVEADGVWYLNFSGSSYYFDLVVEEVNGIWTLNPFASSFYYDGDYLSYEENSFSMVLEEVVNSGDCNKLSSYYDIDGVDLLDYTMPERFDAELNFELLSPTDALQIRFRIGLITVGQMEEFGEC